MCSPTSAGYLDLPDDQMPYAVVPGPNTSVPWMTNCCYPNAVHMERDYCLWCKLPLAGEENEEPANASVHWPPAEATLLELNNYLGSCLAVNGRDINESRIFIIQASGAAAGTAPFSGVAMMALLAAVFVGLPNRRWP